MFCFFSVRGEEKYEKNYKKRKKIFSSFREVFLQFLVASFPEKMIRTCFGGKEKKYRAKKGNLKKKVFSAFFRHNVSEKRSVCW